MNTSLEPLPFTLKDDSSLSWSERLTLSVIIAFVQGELKPGDSFPSPSIISHACAGHHQEVLESITLLLTRKILAQDCQGNLTIHKHAAPSMEMKRRAFLTNARQLVKQARQWHLSRESVRALLREATESRKS